MNKTICETWINYISSLCQRWVRTESNFSAGTLLGAAVLGICKMFQKYFSEKIKLRQYIEQCNSDFSWNQLRQLNHLLEISWFWFGKWKLEPRIPVTSRAPHPAPLWCTGKLQWLRRTFCKCICNKNYFKIVNELNFWTNWIFLKNILFFK